MRQRYCEPTRFVSRRIAAAVVSCLLFFFCVGFLFSAPAHAQEVVSQQVMLEMKDGVKLYTDIRLPKAKGKWPVILLRTPYGSANNNIESALQVLVSFNVVLVTQYMRGLYKSEGEDTVFANAKDDGATTVKWIRQQEWCDGTVTLVGASALAIATHLMAEADVKVDAQLALVAGTDLYAMSTMGGVMRESLVIGWLNGQARSNNMPVPHPILKTFANAGHSNDDVWESRRIKDWSKVSVPTLHIGGWYDCFSQNTMNAYKDYSTKGDPIYRSDQKLILGPWTHSGFVNSSQGDLSYPANSRNIDGKGLIDLLLAWIVSYVKAEPGGIRETMAPVNLYVMGAVGEDGAPGNKWIKANEWPVPAQATPYYFHQDGTLTTTAPTEANASKTYAFDPKNPVKTRGGQNLRIKAGPVDQTSVEKGRKDILSFETAELSEPVAVVGRLKAKLWVATDAKDTDFTVKLMDVYPDGRRMLVLDGITRLRHRNTTEKDEFVTPGQVAEIEVDLWSTALIFNKGHKIRISVSSSNAPRFQVNPNTGEAFALQYDYAKNSVVANNTLHLSQARPSHIILPIIQVDALNSLYDPSKMEKFETEATSEATTDGGTGNDETPEVTTDTVSGNDEAPETPTDAGSGSDNTSVDNPNTNVGGCGCQQQNGAGGVVFFCLLLGLFVLRRRSRFSR